MGLLLGGPETGNLGLQQRDRAGAVIFSLAELLFQAALHLGKGDLFVTGGNERADAPLQVGIGVNGQAAGGDEGAALVDGLGYAQKRFAAAGGIQAGDRGVGAGIGAGKNTQRSIGALGPAAESQLLVPRRQLQLALHKAAAPGLKTVLIGQIAPLAGVEPIEHGQQESAPGGLAALVRGADHIQPRLQVQPGLVQLSVCGVGVQELQNGTPPW